MSAVRPTVYLDANIISAMYYAGGDRVALAHKVATWEWWEHERPLFAVVTSGITEMELADGVYDGQKNAVVTVRRIEYLPDNKDVRRTRDVYLHEAVVPATRPADAVHLAFASVHGVDYLLSWNHSHLANEETQRKLERVNRRLGWRTPLLRSPFTIPKAALGQQIRRRS